MASSSHSRPSSAQAATSKFTSIAGPGTTTPALLVEKHGKPHHPFPPSIAPYPVNFEKAVIDADSLEVAFRLQLFEGNPSSIPAIRLDNSKTHPRRCLDVGCGSGDWLLAAAKAWPNTSFVGLDLMIGHQLPVHLLGLGSPAAPVGAPAATATAARDPGSSGLSSSISHLRTTPIIGHSPGKNTTTTSSENNSTSTTSTRTRLAELSALESRIQWVQANFLKTLPFHEGEFDYIHISGISRGVPEDKWDGFLSEISRILAPNGHLEMIEEDVIFPILPSSSTSSLLSCEPDHHPPPSNVPSAAMPFDQLSHNASVSAISNNAKRSFRTSTSSSFYCIGNESLGDVLSSNNNNNNSSESSSSPSQSSGSTAGPKSLHAGSPSFSNPFHTRRLSAASRFLAAAAPVPPPVPPLSLDTVLGRRVAAAAAAAAPVLKEDDASSSSSPSLRHETVTTPSQQFPFQTASSSTADSKLFNGPGGVLVGGSLPSKTRAASVSKRSHDPAIPFGWDGPPPSEPVSPPQSPNDTTAFPSNTGKQRKSSSSSSRRPKTTSSLASSIVSMTNKSLSKFHRPTSAGSSMISSSSSITAVNSVDEPVPAVPRLPSGKGLMTLGLRRGSAYDSSSVSRRSSHPKLFATTTPLSPPPLPQSIVSQMQTIKHDHELLQTLFYGVFERRFINTCPTAILPSMLNIYFQNVLVTPPIDFPTPPPPAMAREMCRREKRNMTQREQGRGGLEYSQGVGLHVAQSLNNIKAAAAVVSPQIARLKGTMGMGTGMGGRFHLGSSSPSSWNSGEVESHKLVKRARSSPALRVSSSQGFTGASAGVGGGSGNSSLQQRPFSRALSPDSFVSAKSSICKRSDSPASSGVSFVATPTSANTSVEPMIQSPTTATTITGINTRYLGGRSIHDSAISPDTVAPPFIGVQGSKDEEEDAKFAIMGDGGCFTVSSSGSGSSHDGHGPLDPAPAVAASPKPPPPPSSSTARHRSIDVETMDGAADSFFLWKEEDEEEEEEEVEGKEVAVAGDDLDFLTCDGVEDLALKELQDFDHVAAQELGVFDGVAFEAEEEMAAEEMWDSRELLRERVYVRPRATFAGQGLPVPSALLELDDLSMGLHLTRCWTNVVACKESMWEELQRRARLVGNPEAPDAVRRISPLDEIQWVGTERRLSERDKFDLLFQRFEDDMRAWAAVGSEIPRKLSWIDPRFPHHGPVPPLHHKKSNLSSPIWTESRRGSASAASSITSPVQCYGWDDNRGPGKQGIVTPGVDTCRTLRVFIARKTIDGPSPGGNPSKILSILG